MVRETLNNLKKAAKEIGLAVNEHKIKLAIQSRKRRNRIRQNITIGDHFEVVNSFFYLGFNITTNNNEGQEVRSRLSYYMHYCRS